MTVKIIHINHGFDLCEWACAKHVAWWRAKGATVKVGAVVEFPCDRCSL